MDQFIKAIPLAAVSPLALVAYMVAIAAWLLATLQVQKANRLFATIKDLPEADRIEALKLEYRTVPRTGLTGEEWLRSRKMLFLLIAATVTVLAAITVVAMTLSVARQRQGPVVAFQGVIFGNIENRYVHHDEVSTPAASTGGDARLVVEDARFVDNQDLQLDHKKPHREVLQIRFTVYNGARSAIRIHDFKAVEYRREHTVSFHSPPEYRFAFKIEPERPFIEANKTYEVGPGDSTSFILSYTVQLDAYGTYVLMGLMSSYGGATLRSGTMKSDKLIFVDPPKAALFDTSVVTSMRRFVSTFKGSHLPDVPRNVVSSKDGPPAFASGWATDYAEEMASKLDDAIQRHNQL